MILRRHDERGAVDFGWLRSFHTFSFGEYFDEAHMGFLALRVLNDDTVAPHMGFARHPHRDMEIVSYVLDGTLRHRDSMGNGSLVRRGDVQRMSAGTGVLHSEDNPGEEPVHFLQIWFIPEQAGLQPSYEQKTFPDDEKRGRLRLVLSRDGRDGSVSLHQDVDGWATVLDGDPPVRHDLGAERMAWVHVARGAVTVNGERLVAGDAAAIGGEPVELTDGEGAEVLILDLDRRFAA
jgi:redox-sensitive bicupin YhaK (pirin superfamily)